MLIALVAFSFMNVAAKFISYFHFSQLVMVRSVFALVFCGIMLKRRGTTLKSQRQTTLILRGLFGTGAICLFFMALQRLPLATTIVLQNLSPIFQLLITAWITQEVVAKKQWFYFLLCFVGIIFIRGFDPEISGLGITFGVGSAIFSAFAQQMIRKTETKEDPYLILFYFSAISILFVTPIGFSHWARPIGPEIFYMLLLGVSSFIGQMFLTKAFQNGRTQEVGQYGFLQTLFALVLGVIFFEEIVGLWAILGIAIIIVVVILSSRAAKKIKPASAHLRTKVDPLA